MNENVTRVPLVINDGPNGNEHAYNALRLAMNLVKRPEQRCDFLLIGFLYSDRGL